MTGFNTQPPEGGCRARREQRARYRGFNTQPPEGGWPMPFEPTEEDFVSTHSRPKAAGARTAFGGIPNLFQHTAARRRLTANSHNE